MIQQIPQNRFDTGYYRWKHRLILLFSPSWDDPDYLAQTNMFDALDSEFYERDLLLFTFMPSDRPDDSLPGRKLIDSADHWRQFDLVPHNFALIVVDKDGRIRLRSDEPIHPALLFQLVDQLPTPVTL